MLRLPSTLRGLRVFAFRSFSTGRSSTSAEEALYSEGTCAEDVLGPIRVVQMPGELQWWCGDEAPLCRGADRRGAVTGNGRHCGGPKRTGRQSRTEASAPPPPSSPHCVRNAGKGRSVTATADIELGDLIACARPAAVLHGPVDEAPDAPLLVPQLAALRPDALPWAARTALLHMSDGTGAPAAAAAKAAARTVHAAGGQHGGLVRCIQHAVGG